MYLDLFIVLFFILLNAYFVICEIVLISVRRTKLEEFIRQGDKRALLVKQAIGNLPVFLSASQVGVTLASLALGASVQPVFERILSKFFTSINSGFFSIINIPIVSLFLAFSIAIYLQLVFGELAPKTAALQKPEKYSLFIIPPLYAFVAIFNPLIWIVTKTTKLILRLIGLKDTYDRPYSEDEIKMIINYSNKKGIISETEMELANNVFKLKRILVKHIMVPKNDIVSFDGKKPIDEVKQKIIKSKLLYNRYPVYLGSNNNIIGFFHITDVLRLSQQFDEKIELHNLPMMKKLLYVNEEEKVDKLLIKMRRDNVRAAVVVNGKNQSQGLVTFTDILDHLAQKQ